MRPALLAALMFIGCTSTRSATHYPPEVRRVPPAETFSSDADLRVLAGGWGYETTAAVSRANASQAVVGVISTGPVRRAVDVYTTHDGGVTWRGAPLPTKGSTGREYPNQGDPVVTADRLGVFHFMVLMSTAGFTHTAVAAMRSTDGGRTWSDPAVIAELTQVSGPDRQFDDKQWIAVDDTGGPNDGNVYLLWQRLWNATTPIESRMMFARSTDRGVTWSAPVALTERSSGGQSMVDVGPDGEVYIGYYRAADGGHVLRKSTDGGATFGAPVRMPSVPWMGGPIPNTKTASFRGFPILLADRSNGPHRGNLYLVVPTPSTSTTGKSVGAAAFARSTDGGATWSTPRIITTPTTGDALFPSGAVDQVTGELVVAWMDRRDDPANTLARLYATRSHDGGLTFDAPVGFSPQFSVDAEWLGDYYGVAAHDGTRLATFSNGAGQMSAVRLGFAPAPVPRKGRVVR
jgi:BNR repeat-like domain